MPMLCEGLLCDSAVIHLQGDKHETDLKLLLLGQGRLHILNFSYVRMLDIYSHSIPAYVEWYTKTTALVVTQHSPR